MQAQESTSNDIFLGLAPTFPFPIYFDPDLAIGCANPWDSYYRKRSLIPLVIEVALRESMKKMIRFSRSTIFDKFSGFKLEKNR